MILIRYVLRQFLATFFFTLIALSVLFVIIHLFDNGLEKIIDRNVSIGDATMYYVTYLPFILKLLLPVATLLAALFGVGRLASSNELTAMSASGLGAMRFLAPYLVIGLLISVGQVYFNGWVVPQANALNKQIARSAFNEGSGGSLFNLYFRDVPTRNVYIEYYDKEARTARSVRIEEFGSVEHPRIQWRIDAAEMTWDVEAQHWIAEHAERRVFEADSIEIQELDSFAMPFTIHHDAIVRLQRGVDELTIDEVDDYIATLKAGGKDTRMQEIDYYGAWAFPFSNVVIIFIAVPFASVRRRGGIAVNVAAAMVVAFGYIAFTEVSKAIGLASDVSPAVIGWSANAVFLLVALFAMMVLRR